MRKKRLFILLLFILGAAATTALSLARAGLLPGTGERLTILMYHHIVPDDGPVNGMTVTVSRFEEDVKWLKAHGYASVLPRELAAGDPLPRKAVMITFDDGYASNYTYAFPILRQQNMKAAIAVVGRVVDADDEAYLDWDMCREMDASGLVELGSHTYDLHNLDGRGGSYDQGGANGIERMAGESREAYEARVLPDLQKSIDVIERELGSPVCYLAYPYGATDPWAEDFIRAHFSVTILVKSGTANLSGGLYGLPRKTVTMDSAAADCFGPAAWLRDFWRQIRNR